MESYLTGEIYPVIGNHDTCPVNSFPPAAVDTTITTTWAYDTLSVGWESWIGSSAASEVEDNYGSYSVLTSSGLRIISLNTNFWYKQNFWMYEATMEQDPSDMLSWLVSALASAESASERVWIIGTSIDRARQDLTKLMSVNDSTYAHGFRRCLLRPIILFRRDYPEIRSKHRGRILRVGVRDDQMPGP
jgi:hypothetical protein